MNQRLLFSLTAAMMATALGTASSTHAEPVTRSSMETVSSSRSVSDTATLPGVQPPEASPEKAQAQPNANGIAKTLSYNLQGYQATTLYVRSIPVLTFIGSRITTTDRTTVDPVVAQAASVAARLNELNRSNVDAQTIVPTWNSDRQTYTIKVNGEDLVEINNKIILPDTTRNIAQDTLQAANRIRRLMGNARPVATIAGLENRRTPQIALNSLPFPVQGMASWYGPGFHGNRSANGEVYNQNAMTAAHRRLPFGTLVQVTNLNNGRSVVVRITDRGPFSRGRVIDLSAAAARRLGMMGSGVAPVRLDIFDSQETATIQN